MNERYRLGGNFVSGLAERLRELREQRNVMQKDVAAGIDVPLRTYQRYEYGQVDPQFSTVVKLADFYGVSLDYLAGRSEER